MKKAILGKKLGMTQVFKEDRAIPVTVIKAGPCVVTQLRDEQRDGYSAVQMGFEEVTKTRKVTLPMKGHFDKAGCEPQRFLAEVPLDPADYEPGQLIKVDELFEEGDSADVTGVSKGKGFAGVVKRWGFHGGPATHGSRFHRAPGAIGQCADPAKVFKGKKLPGHMGAARVTVQNLSVVEVDGARDLLLVEGAVPGPRGSLLIIRESVKSKAGSGKR